MGQIDTNTLDKVIAKPWAADGKNFSDRIWDRKSEMINSLHNELTRMLILGKAPDEAIKNMTRFVSGKVKNAKNAAATLVMTEDSYFHSVSQKKVYADLEVEEYEIVATLDLKTSEVCQEMDGKHLPLKDFAAGSTAPPFHPRCRSLTAPYFDDDFAVGERAARDADGKTYYVPGDMSYKEWIAQQEAVYGKENIDKAHSEIEDITQIFINVSSSHKGKVIVDDSERSFDTECANWLYKTFGGDITLLKENAQLGKMPDALWNGKLWEFKKPTTKNAIDNRLRTAVKQIEMAADRMEISKEENGILLDLTNITILLDDAIKNSQKFAVKRCKYTTKIILKSGDDLIQVFRVNKE